MASLDEKDVQILELMFDKKLNEHLAPVRTQLGTHHQTLFGVNNNNGLSGDMKEVKKTLGELKVWKAKVIGYASGISAGIPLLLKYIWK